MSSDVWPEKKKKFEKVVHTALLWKIALIHAYMREDDSSVSVENKPQNSFWLVPCP